MTEKAFLRLEDRALLSVSGDDARGFLQGIVSNDVDKATDSAAVHAALLTPQGKYLHDFFVFAEGEALMLDCEAARLDDLRRRLTMYRLRAKIDIATVDDRLAVYAILGDDAASLAGPYAGGVVYADPRLAALGARAALPDGGEAALEADGFRATTRAAYEALRLGLGVPDGSRDLIVERSLPLENGFDELNGVDFEKGCYVGQEVTARMKHRALVRKRLLPVTIDGPTPDPGTPVFVGDVEAGEMRSAADGKGLALLRLDRIEAGPTLVAGSARLVPRRPDWMRD